MTASIWFANIGAFALQLAVIIGVGVALSYVVRLERPRAALAYWRLLLLACLLLPLYQPWTAPAPSISSAVVTTTIPVRDAAWLVAPPSIEAPSIPWTLNELLLTSLLVGIAARGLWLIVGALSLVQLRRSATPLVPAPAAFHEAQARLGVRATVAVSDRVSGPITFGLVNPIVILPPDVPGMDVQVQEAIAYHELLHVRRRDWLDEILEEIIRTVFWFHPAVWWLVGRIQLSREQVVDQAAIELTESRERYVHALLTVALARRSLALVPAPLFLRRRHLKKRVMQILQETTMTTRRLIASLTISGAALGLAAVLAVHAFPLQAQGQAPGVPGGVPGNGEPIQIVKGGDHLLHAALPEYPRRAIEQRVEGDVVLELAIDDRGEVADARVLSGPDELRRAALEAVLQWHYSPAALRSASTQATLRFHVPPPNSESVAKAEYESKVYNALIAKAEEAGDWSPGQRAERQMVELERALNDPSVSDADKEELKAKYAEAKMRLAKWRAERSGELTATLTEEGKIETKVRNAGEASGPPRLVQVRSERVSADIVKDLMATSGLSIGDLVTEQAAKRLRDAAQSIDEHLRVEFDFDGKRGLTIVFILP